MFLLFGKFMSAKVQPEGLVLAISDTKERKKEKEGEHRGENEDMNAVKSGSEDSRWQHPQVTTAETQESPPLLRGGKGAMEERGEEE